MEIGDTIEANVRSVETFGIWPQSQGKTGLVVDYGYF
jgi:hypothetical protein